MTDVHNDTPVFQIQDASVEAQTALRLFVHNLETFGAYSPAENPAPTVSEDGTITLEWSSGEVEYVFTADVEGRPTVKKIEGNHTHTVNYPENPFVVFTQLVEKIL